MMVEVKNDVEIPGLALVHCPMKDRSHLMKNCSGCPHNIGLTENPAEKSEQLPFGERYRLVCTAPIPRKITVLED